MILPLPVLHPGTKVPHFSVVSIICEPHLRANEQNLFVVHDHTAIVNHILVYYGPINVSNKL